MAGVRTRLNAERKRVSDSHPCSTTLPFPAANATPAADSGLIAGGFSVYYGVTIPRASQTIFRFLVQSDAAVDLFWLRNAWPDATHFTYSDANVGLNKGMTMNTACEPPNTTWFMRIRARSVNVNYNVTVSAVGERTMCMRRRRALPLRRRVASMLHAIAVPDGQYDFARRVWAALKLFLRFLRCDHSVGQSDGLPLHGAVEPAAQPLLAAERVARC
jgi:hypothetical protein